MESKTAVGDWAHNWRIRCLRSPELFASLGGSPAARHLAEKSEDHLIGRIVSDADIATRAAAIRGLAELRKCSVRQVTVFFDVECEVVVAALSLLEVTIPAAGQSTRAA